MFIAVSEQLWNSADVNGARMAMAFIGGLGGTHEEMCGALSAGAMVIGLLFAPDQPGGDEQRLRGSIAAYRERFLREIGPTRCGSLRDGLYGKDGKQPCSTLVRRAIQILSEIIEQAVERTVE